MEEDLDASVSRLMYVRMKTGEFDDASLQKYRKIPYDAIRFQYCSSTCS